MLQPNGVNCGDGGLPVEWSSRSQMEDSLVDLCQIGLRNDSIAWLVGLDIVVYPWSTECEKVALLTVHEQRKILDSERMAEQG